MSGWDTQAHGNQLQHMTVFEVVEMLREHVELLDGALLEHHASAVEWADADTEYRKAKAQAYVRATGSTVSAREAEVDIICEDARRAQRLAQAKKEASLEAVRSRRTQLSAVQSLAALIKSEADLARTGPSGR